MPKPSVFIGSSIEGLAIAHAVQRNLERDADVTIWNQGHFSAGASTLESLMAVLNSTDFAVMVVTRDDADHVSDRSRPRARDNVLFEAGLFMGRLGTQRTFLLVEDDRSVPLPTDLAGVTVARFDRRRADDNLEAALAPACERIRHAMKAHMPKPEPTPEYSTCFISHSAKDAQFAERLYRDLQEVGVRCWLDSKELKIGDRWQVEIDRAIRSLDKVLLVLSRASVRSGWVKREIEVALEREVKDNRTILLPLRLDDAVMESNDQSSRRLVRSKQISDFTNWQSADEYKRAFSRLARELTVIAATETESQSNA